MSHFNLIYKCEWLQETLQYTPAISMSSLEFDSAYWEQHLSDGMQKGSRAVHDYDCIQIGYDYIEILQYNYNMI